ncbi:MAG: DUF3575 domain-containing protein [Bacteroidota bacterium]
MKKPYYLIILVLICKIGSAQDTLKFNRIIFKIAPINFFDDYSFKTTQVGFEFRFTPKYSIDFSYGQVFGKESIDHFKGTGFKAKSEIRRYRNNKKAKKLSRYFALEGFYHKIDYPARNLFKNSTDSSSYGEDFFIKKNVWGLNVKYGFTCNFLKRLVLDVYGGVGIRIKDVQHLNRTRPDDRFDSRHFLAHNIRDQKGFYPAPNLTLAFKIGYVLK